MYYRIAKFYKSWGELGYEGVGMIVLFACIAYNIVFVIVIVSNHNGWDIPERFLNISVLSLAVIGNFLGTERLYNQLDMKYKNELHTTLKGWLIAIYVGISFILLCICWWL